MSATKFLLPSFIISILSNGSAFALTSEQMHEAMQRHICPADPQEVSFLDYSSCGPQPSGASSEYFHCQNRIDAENDTIAKYDEFMRSCSSNNRHDQPQQNKSAAKAGETKPEPQSELARAAEAAKKKAENSATANAAAVQQLRDHPYTQVQQPTPPPPPPQRTLTLHKYGRWNFLYSFNGRRPNCGSENGLTVCKLPYENEFDQNNVRGQCIDIRGQYDHLCIAKVDGVYRFLGPGNDFSRMAYCVDVLCVP
jgi:hypothetical protein